MTTDALDLDGWAVASASGVGVDDTLRQPRLRDVLGRRLYGTCAARGGAIRTKPIVRLVGRGGVVEAHAADATVWRLGESVWSQIGRAPAGASER